VYKERITYVTIGDYSGVNYGDRGSLPTKEIVTEKTAAKVTFSVKPDEGIFSWKDPNVKKLPHGHLRYVGNCEGGPSSTYEQCLEDAFKNSRKIE